MIREMDAGIIATNAERVCAEITLNERDRAG